MSTISAAAYKAGQSEDEFQDAVVEMALYSGWVVVHVRDMRGEDDGLPDLLLWRGDRYLLVELKAEHGKERASQKLWRYRAAQRGVTVHLWRPSDGKAIEMALTASPGPNTAPLPSANTEKGSDVVAFDNRFAERSGDAHGD